MDRCAYIGWGEVKKTGKTKSNIVDKEIQRHHRHEYYLCEHAANLKKENAGTHLIVYNDESYVHEMHNGEYSLLPRDRKGNLITNVSCAVRNGRRVCFSGSFTKYSHVVGMDKNNKHIRDCAWLDKNGNEVLKGGSFYELNNDGKPRFPKKKEREIAEKLEQERVITNS